MRSASSGKRLLVWIFSALIFLGAGYWVGYAVTMNTVRGIIQSIKPIRENNSEYHFIYPLLYYDFGKAGQFFEDHNLDAAINSFVGEQYAAKNASSISVSVREFQTLARASVNDTVTYEPGSMLKVLIMMAYFREAQADPATLQKRLTYSENIAGQSASLDFSLPSELRVGSSYTVDSLIKTMIADSDNGAETLLINNINRTVLNQAYVDLGIPSPDTVVGEYTISPAQYISFLRILFNSTYLSEKYSEEALSIMSQSAYKEGIVAGVPSSTVVAQKYGERVLNSGNGVDAIELHDCGIVYVPGDVYAICIMTKGSDVNHLTSIVKNLSSLIYQYIVAH